jgi:protein-tyrosine phosphatase
MAAALLDAHLRAAEIPAEVASAGVLAGGKPAWPEAAAALAGRGLSLSGHVSAALDLDAVRGADLIVGMAREHVREVATLVPDALSYTFTLKEIVRRGEVAPRGDVALGDWLARLSAPRRAGDLLGASPDDDVADPIGGSRRRFRAAAAELEDLVVRLIAVAWPPSRDALSG